MVNKCLLVAGGGSTSEDNIEVNEDIVFKRVGLSYSPTKPRLCPACGTGLLIELKAGVFACDSCPNTIWNSRNRGE